MELNFPVILDGATGTELQNRGYDGRTCAETWVLEHPEVLQQIQKEYIDAGSNVIYAETFGANRIKLEENGIFNQVEDYNRRLVAVSKEAARDKALVAGDMTTSGKFLSPVGDITFDELYDIYHEQAKALEEAGVDMFVIETIMTVPDARAAVLAVRDVSDKPILVSFTCDEKGRTLTGTDICAALVTLQGMDIDAFGMNCSTGPDQMIEQAKRMSKFAELPISIKPNAGLPETINGETVYNCSPDEFVKYTEEFAELGAVMFGGCCGTEKEHIKALSDKLKGIEFKKFVPAEHDDIVCATEKDVFVLNKEDIRIDSIIKCGSNLEDSILKANRNDSMIIAIEIESEEELEEFEYAQNEIRKPLCIVCDDAKILDRALRVYQGRAIYAGSIKDEDLIPLMCKYGVIA